MTGSAPRDDRGHREMRERIGDFVLGLLPSHEAVALQAHLDGCPSCRAELAELEPLAQDLRLVDPELLPGPPAPPADLGARIGAAVRAEAQLRDRRDQAQARRRRLKALLVPASTAVAAAAATVLVMSALNPGLNPAQPVTPTIVTEHVAVRTESDRITGTDAELVAHTWGLEVKLVASGLTDGRAYRAVVRTRDGRSLPAGAFLGTGSRPVRCNLQAALLRDDAAGFSVVDSSTGQVVLSASLPTSPEPTA